MPFAFRFVLALSVWVITDSAQTQEVGSVQQGLRVARQQCAQCHLLGTEAGRSTNPSAPTFKTIANTPGLTSTALAAMLQTSHRNMPNIVIRGAEVNDIIAYILSLRDSD
jgi:mono/diheme cytochrome c family protein